jgi:hypothetical protein|tara:strand:+ start:870 stop:1085 length:216 start_codon:yes stop_codon:yes gene_type:complete
MEDDFGLWTQKVLTNMEDDFGLYEPDEGSDVDNWEAEQVFQDHEGQEDEETDEWQPHEDFGYFGEMGLNED